LRSEVCCGSIAGGEFHVCGLVVHVRPDRLDAVADALGSLSGVELHARSPQGKLVITLEARTQDDVVRTMAGIGDMPGVLSTALVYQHAEADSHSPA